VRMHDRLQPLHQCTASHAPMVTPKVRAGRMA